MTEPKQKKIYIYTKGHVKGDKIERTEEKKENQGSKAVRWPAAVIIENALPRTIPRAILRNSHINSLWSPLWPASKPPIRCTSEVPLGPMMPDVSFARGTKWKRSDRVRYLVTLHSSGCLATLPGSEADLIKFEQEKLSLQVASQTSDWPAAKGKMVISSGLLPSPRSNPTGSRMEGKPTASRLRFMMSLSTECRGKRPTLRRQDKG